MIDFRKVSIKQLHEMYVNKEVSVEEVISGVLTQTKANKFNEYISDCKEDAIVNARKLDEAGVVNLFDGIPCAIKDNMNYIGYLNTNGSKITQNYKSIYNATVTQKILDSKAIITAKCNMDEFAMGDSNTTSYFGNVLNPYDSNRISGGSSGGSAVSVASGAVPFALGSDTGGSVRQPAAYCGIVGFRPTYGMISRYGVVTLNCSFDQVGIFANRIEDAALVFDMLQGKDILDSTTLDMKLNCANNLDFDASNAKIAIVKSTLDTVSESVAKNMENIEEFLKPQVAKLDIVEFDFMKYVSYVYLGIVATEITSNLTMFDGIRYGYRTNDYTSLDELYSNTRSEGFGNEVKRRLLIGTDLLKNKNYDRYLEILKLRRLIFNEFQEFFKKYDYILTPTAPTVAYTFDEYANLSSTLYESEFVEASVLAGLPGVSVPMGIEKSTKMHLGLQIIANRMKDDKVLAFGKYVEDNYKVGEY